MVQSLALLFALSAGLGAVAEPKGEPKGKMPEGFTMPDMTKVQKKGPPWRQIADKVLSEACQMNRGSPSVFCFPDMKHLQEGLLSAADNGADLGGEMFLMDLHSVLEQLLAWPSAWSGVKDMLSTSLPWTRAYCEKIVGDSPIWHPVPIVRKNSITPRQTLAQVEKTSPYVAAAMFRWFDDLKKNGDGQTKILLDALKTNDKVDIKSRSAHGRPMVRLMQYEHAKLLKHLFSKVCKTTKSAWVKFEAADGNGLTPLHHMASMGNAAGVHALLKSVQKAKRSKWAGARDKYGYTPEDWALLGDFNDTVATLRKLGGEDTSANAPGVTPPTKLVELFRSAKLEGDAPVCRVGESTPGCLAAGDSGWRAPDSNAVPSDWMPPAGNPCFADTIDVSQFDFDAFSHHYLLHPRPLLIKGGARQANDAAGNWSREGLRAVAGERKVSLELFPDARQFDGSKPQEKTLNEYLDMMDKRSEDLKVAYLSKSLRKKLHYAYLPLPPTELLLNFSAKAFPRILEDKAEHSTNTKAEHKGSVFLLGGVLTGTPPHHHGPAINSLVHGSKLWFFDPPGRETVVYETMYAYLDRTKGAPEMQRCMQEAGDLLFVPRGWTHGAICLGDCIGVSHQFTHKYLDLQDR